MLSGDMGYWDNFDISGGTKCHDKVTANIVNMITLDWKEEILRLIKKDEITSYECSKVTINSGSHGYYSGLKYYLTTKH